MHPLDIGLLEIFLDQTYRQELMIHTPEVIFWTVIWHPDHGMEVTDMEFLSSNRMNKFILMHLQTQELIGIMNPG